jgi:hypothetical protein
MRSIINAAGHVQVPDVSISIKAQGKGLPVPGCYNASTSLETSDTGSVSISGKLTRTVDYQGGMGVYASSVYAFAGTASVGIRELKVAVDVDLHAKLECDIFVAAIAGAVPLFVHLEFDGSVDGLHFEFTLHDISATVRGALAGGVRGLSADIDCAAGTGAFADCVDTAWPTILGSAKAAVKAGLKIGYKAGSIEQSVTSLLGGQLDTTGDWAVCWQPLNFKSSASLGDAWSWNAQWAPFSPVRLLGDASACPFGSGISGGVSGGGVSASTNGSLGGGITTSDAQPSSSGSPPGSTDRYFTVASEGGSTGAAPVRSAAGLELGVRALSTLDRQLAAATSDATRVDVTDCDLNGGRGFYWWTGSSWAPVSAALDSPQAGCLHFALTDTTSPNIDALGAGVLFGVSTNVTGTSGGGGSGGGGGGGGGGTGASPGESPPPDDTVVRTAAGGDRLETAVLLSQQAFAAADTAGAVVLARSDTFPDALTGVPLAAAKHAPLLLTDTRAISADVLAEIDRVLPMGGDVFVLGGEGAIAPEVVAAIESAGFKVTRLGGVDRYETAAVIARRGLGSPTTVFEVSGLGFPDALAAGPAAAVSNGAILLTAGTRQSDATAAYLSDIAGVRRIAIGGAAAEADRGATAVVGADRYATATEVARRFFPDRAVIGIATGDNFADGMTGGAFVAAAHAPLLLVRPTLVPASVLDYLHETAGVVDGVLVFGGTDAISSAVVDELTRAVAGP